MGGGGVKRMMMAMPDDDDNGERSYGSNTMLTIRRKKPYKLHKQKRVHRSLYRE